MPRPPETPDVRTSKTLAYILRHGAEKEGLHIRSDGYLKLADVLARPKLKGIDEPTVLRLVAENAKQRFALFWGYDPSPPRPKKRPTQGKTKKQLQRDRETAAAAAAAAAGEGEGVGAAGDGPVKAEGKVTEPDAATLDNLQSHLSKTAISTPPLPPEPIELPLVALPPPTDSEPAPTSAGGTDPKGEWFIRANQGHSLELESTAHLEEVADDESGRARVGECVHGTRWELWDVLKQEGLSKMERQHIHFAPSLTGPITPRPTSTLYIYLDVPKALAQGVKVYTSANGVVLSPGGEGGVIGKELWRKAVRRQGGKRAVVWEEGKEVEREEGVEPAGKAEVATSA
ncbi:hypothetical protein IAT38_001583 [Cryptococcus sp. DSM 104549]